mmetsp:Transcript_37190/g.88789  ORF Transcript_37190/g.88789 Transcript_37190/m.88789 type:complete len:105 (+) Transcript_37190:1038-1352(+)
MNSCRRSKRSFSHEMRSCINFNSFHRCSRNNYKYCSNSHHPTNHFSKMHILGRSSHQRMCCCSRSQHNCSCSMQRQSHSCKHHDHNSSRQCSSRCKFSGKRQFH